MELHRKFEEPLISIPSNIVEGAARKSVSEFRHFLYFSLSSEAELNRQLIIQ